MNVFSTRPVFRFLLPYAAGIAAGYRLGLGPGFPAAVTAAAAAGFSAGIILKRNRTFLFLPFILFCFGIINSWYVSSYTPADSVRHLMPFKYPYLLRAYVTDAPLSCPENRTCRLKLRLMNTEKGGIRRTCSGDIFLYSRNPLPEVIPGDTVEFRGMVSMPGPPRNPGDTDLREIFRQRGIAGSVFLRNQPVTVTEKRVLPSLLFRVRRRFHRAIHNTFSRDAAPLVSSLILGERNGITKEGWRAFRESGTVHLLAISGLHVALLVGTVSLFLLLLGIPIRTRTVILIGLTGVYILLSGNKIPVIRTGIMFIIHFSGILLKKKPDIYNTLGISAFLILLVKPLQIFSPGFLLSYTAVLSLFLLTPLLKQMFEREKPEIERLVPDRFPLLSRIREKAADSFFFSAAAWLGTFPIVLHYFGIFTPYSILANLIAVPLVAFVLINGFTALILSLIFTPLAAPFAWTGSAGTLALRAATNIFSSLPYSAVYMNTDFPVLLFYGILCTMLVLKHTRSPSKQHLRIIGLASVHILMLYTLVQASLSDHRGIHIIDVGHGNAALISNGRHVILSDTGGPSQARTVTQVLKKLGIHRIDLLILSHFDLDHCGGLPALAADIDIEHILCYSPSVCNRDIFNNIMDLADKQGITVIRAENVRKLSVGELSLEILSSPLPPVFPANDRSLVTRVVLDSVSLLLPGDIEQRGITHLLNTCDPGSDIMLLPHHGHPEPGLRRLIREVSPRLVLVSQKETKTGYSEAVFRFCESLNIPHYSTGISGYIRIVPGPPLSIETFFPEKQ